MQTSHRLRRAFTALGYLWTVATLVVLGGELLWPGHHVHVGGKHHHHFFTGPHHHHPEPSAIAEHTGEDHASHAASRSPAPATSEGPRSETPEENPDPTLIDEFTLDRPGDREPTLPLLALLTSLEPSLGCPVASIAVPSSGSPRGPPTNALV